MRLFRRRNSEELDSPQSRGRRRLPRRLGESQGIGSNEVFGRWTETVARGMGTPWFLLVLTLFCAAWLVWNTVAPIEWRFDSAALGFTALTLILSLQASYAAPMILLAQNRQDDRDRVQIEQDRQRAERNLADTEFLAREIVALRLSLKELPDREFVRAELHSLFEELVQDDAKAGDSEASVSREAIDSEAIDGAAVDDAATDHTDHTDETPPPGDHREL